MRLEARVVKVGLERGSINNALDSYLVELAKCNVRKEKAHIFVTRWLPTVSLGNTQSLALDVDERECKIRGVEIVRRRSGGQSVYLDEGYIVVSASFSDAWLALGRDANLDILRERLSSALAQALNKLGVPAKFYPPDNIVVDSLRRRREQTCEHSFPRTLGNAGQVIYLDSDGKPKGVFLQASLRYSDPDIESLASVLKINGYSLRAYANEAKQALACVQEFVRIARGKFENALVSAIAEEYGLRLLDSELDEREWIEVRRLEKIERERVRDKAFYKPRGVCYFFLNGKCLIPSAREWLKETRPSTKEDSCYREPIAKEAVV